MKKILWILVLLLATRNVVTAQEEGGGSTEDKLGELKGQLEGLNETLQEVKTSVDGMKKLKLSGYIQAQYQVADSQGTSQWKAGDFAGGTFPNNVKSRLAVRRGRLKAQYDNGLSQFVLQVDVTQNGVGIKDAYIAIKEPWLKTATFTIGAFDRPFGYEISYSSSQRESPERSRMYQVLFPGEREIGAKIDLFPTEEMGILSHFNLKAGMFNGVLNTANENDNNKDFIGRFGFTLPLQAQNLAIDGGISMYSGKITSNSAEVYHVSNKAFVRDSSASNILATFDRKYLGFDGQVYYDLPVLGGMQVRGEFISGDQPGTAGSSVFYNPGTKQEVKALGDVKTVDNVQPVYKRKFSGMYVMYIQNVGLKNQAVVKYDIYDPNTGVKGSDIGVGSKTSVTDIKFNTLGLGWIYHWDENVKFTAYYEMVKNEKVNTGVTSSALVRFKKDVKDNVFTFRVQYKF